MLEHDALSLVQTASTRQPARHVGGGPQTVREAGEGELLAPRVGVALQWRPA